MELLIRTDWPQFANDVADVVRIFFGAVLWKIEPLSAPAQEGGEKPLVLSHTEQKEEGVVRVLVQASGACSGRAVLASSCRTAKSSC